MNNVTVSDPDLIAKENIIQSQNIQQNQPAIPQNELTNLAISAKGIEKQT